jgi:hypothetical protein
MRFGWYLNSAKRQRRCCREDFESVMGVQRT